MKNPALAALINAIFPGVGYLYIGKRIVFGRFLLAGGILNILGSILLYIYTPTPAPYVFYPVELVSMAGTLAASIAFGYDAYTLAKAK